MFSITVVNIDSYQASPIPELDVTFSEFRGSEIKKVPVIRIFGSTSTGKKTCLHIHGVFPYIYVPCIAQENTDRFAYQLAAAIDSAVNTSLGSTLSTSQHVYKIQRVSGIPFYGYHEKDHLFFKIYFYNPAMTKRTADLLHNGAVLNQVLQPYEAHIPYILQFMIDYNLYGMNTINLSYVKYRQSSKKNTTEEDSQHKTSVELLDSQTYLPASILRQSMCELEVDVCASNIQNRQCITKELELNPGLVAIWDEEKARRIAAGLESAKSQFLFHKTLSNNTLPPTSNDIYQEEQLLKRLHIISQSDEVILSYTSVSSYPVEAEDNNRLLNASDVLNHSESILSEDNFVKSISNADKLFQSTSFLEANNSQNYSVDSSVLDANDVQLVELLANLAEENEITNNVDNNSVLGSQYSMFSEQGEINPGDDEEETENLNITSLDLNSLSSWDSEYKESDQHSNILCVSNKNNHKSSDETNTENNEDIKQSNEDITLINFPQLDGVSDLYENISKYEREAMNDIKQKNNYHAVNTTNIAKNYNYAIRNLHRNVCLADIIKYFVNNFNNCYLKKIYNFVNKCYFHIFIKTSKNLQLTCIHPYIDTDATIKRTWFINNTTVEDRLYHIQYELKLDHRDLDVYDIDKIETDETLENVKQYRFENCEKKKHNCEQNAKLYFIPKVFKNDNHYLYTKIFNLSTKFMIPNIDGATASDSSDSELETDITIAKQEKRICVYKGHKKNVTQITNQMTPKKRNLDLKDDNYESPTKKRNINVKTPKKQYYNSPSKISRSPQCVSGNYSPLNITITSPETAKNSTRQYDSTERTQCLTVDDVPSTSTTPKRKIHPLRVSLLRERRTLNLIKSDLENSANTVNIHDKSVTNEADTVHTVDNINTIETNKTAVIYESMQHHKEVGEDNENLLMDGNKIVCKRLHFENHHKVENTFAISNHVNKPENITGFEHLIDQTYAILSSSNNENVDNVVLSNSPRENVDMSPERNYGQSIYNTTNISLKPHDIIPETDLDEDEEDICNTTFTQHVNQKMENDSQHSSLERSIFQLSKNKLSITITAKYDPPSCDRVLKSMTLYGIPKYRSKKPFFSNKVDLAKQKEFLNSNFSHFNIPAFKSSLEEITGIKLWRRMKVNEFHPSGANIKTSCIKRTLAGYNLLLIKPLMGPPSFKNIKNWVKAKRHLSIKDPNIELHKQDKEKALIAEDTTCNHSINNNSNVVGSVSSIYQQNQISETSEKISAKFEHAQNTNNVELLTTSGDNINSSLQKALENPRLYKSSSTQYSVSYGQIDCLSKGSYSNISNENLQNAKAITICQYLTLLSLEVHTITRENLLPDPQHDSIAALFYGIYNDTPMNTSKQIEHGAIIINTCSINARVNKIYSASASCPILYVQTELDIFNSLITLIEKHNPDILLGWEIETLSWGYVFQRAYFLAFNNFPLRISKIPHMQTFSKSDSLFEKNDVSEIKVPGRNILDVWRIMRHEAALLTYSFENVMYHVLHERIPCPSFKILSTWWKHESMVMKCRVINHYVTRVTGTLKILNHLDVIGRTCEHARIFGIQFYEVFSRGSQYRVESMMLRLAKPLNYIPISPSMQQRAKMRAPEFLPLIMEPQSEFYTDPLIVLDFQSLYPSIIIAYNYCFSTCLGRIEHLGQYGPFEFGAATLRVRKNTAIKLQEKMNFSPCGVAFVKKEVRQGILPRMLTEILNTRLMVKESMKLHPEKNHALQRVLHSQQLGLKLIANVTYGYTSANFSGRMPCIEIGDSVVSKGRETLERAIKLVESSSKWGAQVVYGDTDSLFILLPGKSREEAFTIGEEIADAVTASNPPPVKLKFEKVLHPAILQTKKRYCGYMYETCNQVKPKFLAKGIETVRRDGCPAVAKILEKTLRILFDTKDISLVKSYVIRQFDKIFRHRVSIQDLTFAKEFRGMRGYKANACVPALELTRRLIKKDPRAVPRTSERVRYIIVAGAPNQALIHCVRTPMEVITDPGLIPNSIYYITKVIIPPLNRCFNLFGIDVNTWYKEMSHRQNFNNIMHTGGSNSKFTIRQFFKSIACATCGEQTNKEICSECLSQPNRTILILLEKTRQLERTHQQIASICHSCIGRLGDIECSSLDCPVLYRMIQARKELAQVPYIKNIIYGNYSTGIKELTAVADWY